MVYNSFFEEVDIGKLYTVVMYPWQSLSPAGQKVGMLSLIEKGISRSIILVALGSAP